MKILVTGGAGYIGSHAVVELCSRGHEVVVVDSYVNAQPGVLQSMERISGRPIGEHRIDVRDRDALLQVFREERPQAVMHFAALKSVGESWTDPLAYYDTNIGGLLSLLECMRECRVDALVFSSSATVYGEANHSPIDEGGLIAPLNPYARTKAVGEGILFDVAQATPGFRVASLRYFNPVGAHASGFIGEAPQGVPNNLMPYICQVASGERALLRVFGADYPTSDGTGVRDYVHVVDLAVAHAMALEVLMARASGFVVNLGTGRGHSVLEVVHAFARASGREIPYVVEGRRPGDAATCFADVSQAATLLKWRAERDLPQMCQDAWRWELNRGCGIVSPPIAPILPMSELDPRTMPPGVAESVFAVIPAYNEGQAIAAVLEQALKHVDRVVVVDDASSDDTTSRALLPGVDVLRHPCNLGQGAALQTGIAHALSRGANYIVTLDADGQHDPSQIQGMLKTMRAHDADAALGSRFKGEAIGMTVMRRVVLKLAVAFTRLTTGLDVTDSHNGFRVFTADGARRLRIRQNRMAHASEILEEIARHKIRYVEVPVTIRYTDYSRAKGQSNLNSLNILLDLALHWLRK